MPWTDAKGAYTDYEVIDSAVATDATEYWYYVQEFTKEISREKLLTVRSVMQPANGVETADVTVDADERLSEVAAKILRQDRPVRVLDEGQPIGVIMREHLIDALYGEAG